MSAPCRGSWPSRRRHRHVAHPGEAASSGNGVLARLPSGHVGMRVPKPLLWVQSESGRELLLLMMRRETFCAHTPPGLNHKLRACCKISFDEFERQTPAQHNATVVGPSSVYRFSRNP